MFKGNIRFGSSSCCLFCIVIENSDIFFNEPVPSDIEMEDTTPTSMMVPSKCYLLLSLYILMQGIVCNYQFLLLQQNIIQCVRLNTFLPVEFVGIVCQAIGNQPWYVNDSFQFYLISQWHSHIKSKLFNKFFFHLSFVFKLE